MTVTGIVLDVNETLFSMAPLEATVARAGLDADDVPSWFARVLRKSHARAYPWVASRLGRDAAALALVAVHPWDVQGARSAGLVGAFLDRDGSRWPDHLLDPDVHAATLPGIVEAITGSG